MENPCETALPGCAGASPRLRFTAQTASPVALSAAQAQALGDAYQLLGMMLKLPSPGLFATLESGELGQALDGMVGDLAELGGAAAAERAREAFGAAQADGSITHSALRAAYTALFTSPSGVLLHHHEAQFLYYRDNPDAQEGMAPRMFVNDAALSVERIVKKAGLERNPESNESADCIATEAELLGRLFQAKAALRETAAEGAREPEEQALDAVIREFSFYHVSKWHKAFFRSLEELNHDAFFAGVGALGEYLTGLVMAL